MKGTSRQVFDLFFHSKTRDGIEKQSKVNEIAASTQNPILKVRQHKFRGEKSKAFFSSFFLTVWYDAVPLTQPHSTAPHRRILEKKKSAPHRTIKTNKNTPHSTAP